MSDFARFVPLAGTFQRKRAADCWPEAAFVGESVQVGKVVALGTDHEKLRLLHSAEQSRDRLHRNPGQNTWRRDGRDIAPSGLEQLERLLRARISSQRLHSISAAKGPSMPRRQVVDILLAMLGLARMKLTTDGESYGHVFKEVFQADAAVRARRRRTESDGEIRAG